MIFTIIFVICSQIIINLFNIEIFIDYYKHIDRMELIFENYYAIP